MNNKIIDGIIIDAGHGGKDSGAIGNGLLEKDLNLKAAKYINKRLNELGIPNKMTREEDVYLPKSERIKKVLNLYNNSPNTILLSNHINAGGAEGAEVVYSLKNDSTLAELILNNIEKTGQKKRKAYQRRLPEKPNLDYYYILRESGNTEPVLIEYGFIDNKNDSKKLENNIEKYAEGVVKALTEYINYPYTPPNIIENNVHIVEKGDTLYSISKKYNITIDEIKRINKLEDNNLYIGQELLLKDDSKDNIYIVKRGDTLYSISNYFNIPIDEIKKINNLDNNILSINQELIIPSNNQEEIIEDIELPKEEYSTYEVKKGDSIWKISQNYNISPNELIEINNLDNLTLQIGQKLLVPIITEEKEDYYIVEKGDTLWSIAKNNNISVNEIKEINNLSSNLLEIGQKLILK